jgi:transglutaminase-like putative cysteine protease
MYLGKTTETLPGALVSIPNGAAGTAATLNWMTRFARAGRVNPLVAQTAREILIESGLTQKNFVAYAQAIGNFVRDRILYVRDPVKVERVQTPDATLKLKTGDCDDKATLTSALLESIGIPTRFVAIGKNPLSGFSHVYVEAKIFAKGGIPKWLPIETTEPWEFGRAPSNYARRMVRHVS